MHEPCVRVETCEQYIFDLVFGPRPQLLGMWMERAESEAELAQRGARCSRCWKVS